MGNADSQGSAPTEPSFAGIRLRRLAPWLRALESLFGWLGVLGAFITVVQIGDFNSAFLSGVVTVIATAGTQLWKQLADRVEARLDAYDEARETALHEEARNKITALSQLAASSMTDAAELRAQLAWRTLTAEQATALGEALAGYEGELWVTTVGDDPEAATFHQQVYLALQNAGVRVHWYSGYVRAVGTNLMFGPDTNPDPIVKAFQDIGIKFDVSPA